MKLIHVISLFLVILGGLHLVLTGLGVNFLVTIFGGANLSILFILMGVSILHHGIPVLKSHLAAL